MKILQGVLILAGVVVFALAGPWRRVLTRMVLSLFFVGIGITHFLTPEPFVAIVPKYLPNAMQLVYISGVFEILGGVGLLLSPVRRAAGYGLVALLVAVFPANVHMALHDIPWNGTPVPPVLLWLRLPLQLVLIGLVLWCSRPDLPPDRQPSPA
jgi:uncharacterized membrane protein